MSCPVLAMLFNFVMGFGDNRPTVDVHVHLIALSKASRKSTAIFNSRRDPTVLKKRAPTKF
jgi:hypothetical protein